MVYTVTFNPAIDYIVHAEEMRIGGVNRSAYEEMYCGGKGINVSLVLKELGTETKALGFVAGFTGSAIEEELRKSGVDTDFVHLGKGCSRINVKIKSGTETEINGQGPEIAWADIERLYSKLESLKDGDTIVLAGSIPNTLPDDMYEKLLERLSNKKIKAVVDATGDLLMNVLKYKPFLVKPNIHELGEMFGVEIRDKEEAVIYAKKLKEMGAVNVLVSMAGDGSLLVDEDGKVYSGGVCKGEVKNSVGAGDSMVAGFIAGSQNGDYEYALKLGTAAGGATAISKELAKKDEIYNQLKNLE